MENKISLLMCSTLTIFNYFRAEVSFHFFNDNIKTFFKPSQDEKRVKISFRNSE